METRAEPNTNLDELDTDQLPIDDLTRYSPFRDTPTDLDEDIPWGELIDFDVNFPNVSSEGLPQTDNFNNAPASFENGQILDPILSANFTAEAHDEFHPYHDDHCGVAALFRHSSSPSPNFDSYQLSEPLTAAVDPDVIARITAEINQSLLENARIQEGHDNNHDLADPQELGDEQSTCNDDEQLRPSDDNGMVVDPVCPPADSGLSQPPLAGEKSVTCPGEISELQSVPAATTTKRRRPRTGAEDKKVLEEYYTTDPYPDSKTIRAIAARTTSLNPKQVRNWFSNTRMRRSKKGDKVPLTRRSLEELAKSVESDQQPPMEAWVDASLQSGPVGASAIEAAARRGLQSGQAAFPAYPAGSPLLNTVTRNRASSVISSHISSGGSATSWNSSLSASSQGSFASLGRDRGSRRGRKSIQPRAEPFPPRQMDRRSSPPRPVYYCTFCAKTFADRYEWTRHEGSIHHPTSMWICCSSGDLSVNASEDVSMDTSEDTPVDICQFCTMISPSEEHLRHHKYQSCVGNPESSRTFYRRDQFIQHLHNYHYGGQKHPDPALGCSAESHFGCATLVQKWQQVTPPLEKDDPLLHCGFCGVWLLDWNERQSHVSDHFKVGKKTLSAWWPERLPQFLEDLGHFPDYVQCRYCRSVFSNGGLSHPECRVWSCRYLDCSDSPFFNDILPNDCFVEAPISTQERRSTPFNFPNGFENFHSCNQDIFTSPSAFADHLISAHGARSVRPPERDPLMAKCLQNSQHPLSGIRMIGGYFSRFLFATFETPSLQQAETLMDFLKRSQINAP